MVPGHRRSDSYHRLFVTYRHSGIQAHYRQAEVCATETVPSWGERPHKLFHQHSRATRIYHAAFRGIDGARLY